LILPKLVRTFLSIFWRQAKKKERKRKTDMYKKKDKSNSHIRKVAAQEIFSLDSLRRIYHAPDAQKYPPAMRVIHVQNADWAIPFLLRKYNISAENTNKHHDNTVVADFGRYLRYKKPEMRGGKPFLAGKTWKVQYDPWRGVNKTSFGLDYIKSFPSSSSSSRARRRRENGGRDDGRDRMMQLDDFDDNGMYISYFISLVTFHISYFM
jgi:hypothetical protein